jgi:uncharacterized protein YdaU (DUF1376 family)
MLEHGAYNLLLDYYYAEECPIPLDLDEVYRLVRALLPEERAAVIRVLTRYFAKREDGYHNARADDEIAKGVSAIEQMSEAGKRGAEIRWGNRPPNGVNNKVGNEGAIRVNDAGDDASTNHQPPTTSHQPPATPHAEIIKRYGEHLPMGRQVKPELWNGARAKMLAARWKEDAKRQSLEWWDEFFAYCAKSNFLTGRANRPGRDPFQVSLDWLVTPGNFVKVMEGAYER